MRRSLKMVLTMLVILGLLFTVSAFADTASEVRYSTDGGSTWKEDSLFNALWDNMMAENVQIELLRDITLTSDTWYSQQSIGYKDNSRWLIDGKGHTIKRSGSVGMFFNIEYGNSTVTFRNITLDGGAVWSSNDPATRTNSGVYVNGNGHIMYVDNGCTLILDEGTIIQNSDIRMYGGAICVGYTSQTGGNLIIRNGAEIRNNATRDSGGAICVISGTVEMQGGSMTGNYAATGGGAVFTQGSFTMNGGTISGNASGNNGGGICIQRPGTLNLNAGNIRNNKTVVGGGGVTVLADGATLNMTGGTISGNTITGSKGAGVLVNGGSFNASGAALVSGNTAGTEKNNIYLNSGKTIAVTGALDEQASLGVTTAVSPTSSSSVTVTANGAAAYVGSFFSDKVMYCTATKNNEVQLQCAPEYQLTIADTANGAVAANKTTAFAGETITLTPRPDAGYALDTLTVTDVGGNAVAISNDYSFIMPAGNASVSATFKLIPAAAIPRTGDNGRIGLWLALGLLGTTGMLVLLRGGKRRAHR